MKTAFLVIDGIVGTILIVSGLANAFLGVALPDDALGLVSAWVGLLVIEVFVLDVLAGKRRTR